MATTYEADIIAWANEQAALLRSGNLNAIDIEHIAEEIEDVGKSEQRELANRLAVLMAHLLKWEFQKEGAVPVGKERLSCSARKLPTNCAIRPVSKFFFRIQNGSIWSGPGRQFTLPTKPGWMFFRKFALGPWNKFLQLTSCRIS